MFYRPIIFVLLSSFLFGEDCPEVVEEPVPQLNDFQVYLYDYEKDRILDQVKDLPRFKLSREIREYLTKDYTKEVDEETLLEINDLREKIKAITTITIVDDSEIVDSIPNLCPAFSFRPTKNIDDIIEFGSFAENRLKNGLPDTGIFTNPINFLKHIYWLNLLWRIDNITDGFKVNQELIQLFNNDIIQCYYVYTIVDMDVYPKLKCVTPYKNRFFLKFNLDKPIINLKIEVEQQNYIYGTYPYSYTNSIAIIHQADCNTKILRHLINQRYTSLYISEDKLIFEVDNNTTIRLFDGTTIQAKIYKIEDNVLYLTNNDATFILDLMTSKLIIEKKKPNRYLYSLRGNWSKITIYILEVINESD